jgi:Mycobacterial 4 TMS phage holin, superfamily IV
MTDHPIPIEGAHAGWREQRLRFRPLHLLRSWFVAALALLVAAYILPGAEVKGFLGAAVAAAVIALLNALLPPFIAARDEVARESTEGDEPAPVTGDATDR